MYNDYDGVQHDYTRKQGLVWQSVFLPDCAPVEWQDREKLWNAVEEAEKTKDSRLAREFVVALPIEMDRDGWIWLLTDYIQENFVSEGMCADVAIHDTDGHNPHAHIMLTVRPLDKQGKWQHKTEKEYLCVRGSEERGFTAAEFLAAQHDGWEKQYLYKVGRKKSYLPPSQAQGYERVNKYPKSTKYGRQNPISEHWNSDERLVLWREAWAEAVNQALELAGKDERIDHRSHAERGLEEQPTVHEGVAARITEQRGFVSDRCEVNRQIKADNALLRELKFAVRKLTAAVKNTVLALASAMETLRENMIIFRYQLFHIGAGRQRINKYLGAMKPELERYTGLVQQIKGKTKERKELLVEKKETPILNIPKQRELSRRIAELTEELEELKSEKEMLLRNLECVDGGGITTVKKDIATMENGLKKLTEQERKYTAELNEALLQYAELKEQAAQFDLDELGDARAELRPERQRKASARLESAYGEQYDFLRFRDSISDVDRMLGEEAEPRSIRERLRQKPQPQREQPPKKPKHRDEWER